MAVSTAQPAPSLPSVRSRRVPQILFGLLLAVGAFIPRAVSLDKALTIDEKLWLDRSARFADAVANGNFGRAIETGHPGVTTMWLGGFAQRTLQDDAPLRDRYRRARLAVSVADVILLVMIWLLARPLLGAKTAAVAAVLLAFDPFLLAHNRVLQLDGLQTLTVLASFIALLRASREGSRRMLVLSGVFGGLALLTRAIFAAFLVPATYLVFHRDRRGDARRRTAVWIGAAAAVFVVAWPGMWANPGGAIKKLVTDSGRAAAGSDAKGWFLGLHFDAPGPIFYPVAAAFRSTILTLPAGIAAAVWSRRRRKTDASARLAGAFLIFAAGYALWISLGLKTGDRYVLPALGAVDVAVAIALVHALRARGRIAIVALALGLVVHAVPGMALSPYELAYWNWAAGGPAVAQHVIVTGWGEGLDRAAEDLNLLPGAASLTVATTRITQFDDFFKGRTITVEDSSLIKPGGERADLVLFYISSVQVGRVPEVWARYRDRAPLYELTINGIPYVRVYRV